MRRVAEILQHVPWFVRLMTHVYRLGRPHFTAGVIGVVINPHGQILLVEHVFHPDYPWGMPGGWVDRRETMEESLKRELREELELDVEIETVLTIRNSVVHHYHIDIFYLCRPLNNVGSLSSELLSYQWVSPHDLPPLHSTQQAVIALAAQTINDSA